MRPERVAAGGCGRAGWMASGTVWLQRGTVRVAANLDRGLLGRAGGLGCSLAYGLPAYRLADECPNAHATIVGIHATCPSLLVQPKTFPARLAPTLPHPSTYPHPPIHTQAKKYAFKCHRRNEGGRDHVYPVNSMAFNKAWGTFATGGTCFYEG